VDAVAAGSAPTMVRPNDRVSARRRRRFLMATMTRPAIESFHCGSPAMACCRWWASQ